MNIAEESKVPVIRLLGLSYFEVRNSISVAVKMTTESSVIGKFTVPISIATNWSPFPAAKVDVVGKTIILIVVDISVVFVDVGCEKC